MLQKKHKLWFAWWLLSTATLFPAAYSKELTLSKIKTTEVSRDASKGVQLKQNAGVLQPGPYLEKYTTPRPQLAMKKNADGKYCTVVAAKYKASLFQKKDAPQENKPAAVKNETPKQENKQQNESCSFKSAAGKTSARADNNVGPESSSGSTTLSHSASRKDQHIFYDAQKQEWISDPETGQLIQNEWKEVKTHADALKQTRLRNLKNIEKEYTKTLTDLTTKLVRGSQETSAKKQLQSIMSEYKIEGVPDRISELLLEPIRELQQKLANIVCDQNGNYVGFQCLRDQRKWTGLANNFLKDHRFKANPEAYKNFIDKIVAHGYTNFNFISNPKKADGGRGSAYWHRFLNFCKYQAGAHKFDGNVDLSKARNNEFNEKVITFNDAMNKDNHKDAASILNDFENSTLSTPLTQQYFDTFKPAHDFALHTADQVDVKKNRGTTFPWNQKTSFDSTKSMPYQISEHTQQQFADTGYDLQGVITDNDKIVDQYLYEQHLMIMHELEHTTIDAEMADYVRTFTDIAFICNQQGEAGKASALTDFALQLLDYAKKGGYGITQGGYSAISHTIEYPLETASIIAAGQVISTYFPNLAVPIFVGQTAYTVGDLTYSYFYNPERWNDHINQFDVIIDYFANEETKYTGADAFGQATKVTTEYVTKAIIAKQFQRLFSSLKKNIIQVIKRQPKPAINPKKVAVQSQLNKIKPAHDKTSSSKPSTSKSQRQTFTTPKETVAKIEQQKMGRSGRTNPVVDKKNKFKGATEEPAQRTGRVETDQTKKNTLAQRQTNKNTKTVNGTGENCRIVRPLDEIKAEVEWAPKKWEQIRTSTNDIAKIAKNTGMSEPKIQRIKDHLFFNKHQLRDGRFAQFDPDAEIAAAWDRLTQGDYITNDIHLLEHEYFESKFEKLFKTDYDTAHKATIDSKRTWNPPTFMD
jgi:hypothetical protein